MVSKATTVRQNADGSLAILFLPVLRLCALVFSCAAEFSLASGDGQAIIGASGAGNQQSAPSVSCNANVQFLGPYKSLTLWQLPPKGWPVQKVLVIFGSRADPPLGPYQYWDASPSCPLCKGFPENRRIVLDALSRNYAVIAVTNLAYPEGDWAWVSWPEDSPDVSNAILVISEWKRAHGLEDVPTVGLGISAGGHGVSAVALHSGFFQSITLMISGGQPEAIQAATDQYPPTYFVLMPRDDGTEKDVSNSMRALRSKGVETEAVKWYSHPLTRHWFAGIIPGLNTSTSETIVSAFKDDGLLDENNFLYWPPSGCDWQSSLRERKLLLDDAERNGKLMYQDAIEQEMSVAFARHVTLSRKNEEMFAWFELNSGRPRYQQFNSL